MPLPAGYTLDQPQGGPNLPAGYKLDTPPTTRPDTSGSMALDFMQGGGAELISTALGAYNLLRKIPGADKVLPAVSPEVQQYAEPPHTVAAKLGGIFTQLGEFAVPAGEAAAATKGAGLVARAGAQAAAAGGTQLVRTGGDVPSAADAAALGAAGPVVGAALGAAAPVAGRVLRTAPGIAADVVGMFNPKLGNVARVMIKAGKAAAAGAEEAAPAAVDPLLDNLAQGYGAKDFANLGATEQATVRNLAARMTGGQAAAAPTAPPAYVPRPPEYYGVKPAEVPPTNPAPSAPAPAQPASAAAPATPSVVPAAPAPESAIPFEAVRKTGPQDALEGVGGGVGPGFNVYKVPTEKLVPSEDISGMPEKMADVSKYAEKLKAGSEPPALFGHYDPDTGNVVVTSGSRRMMAAQQAGAPDVPVAIPKAAPGAEETLGIKPEAQQPKPATGATAAKSQRYADAIASWAKDMGMSPKAIADQWGTTTPEVRGQIILQLKSKGYLGANETIPRTSAEGIVDALKAKSATIKPPAGFSMGSMKQYPPQAAPSAMAEAGSAPAAVTPLSERLQGIADDAMQRIRDRGTFSGTKLNAGVPVDDLGDMAIWGAAKIAKGTVDFAKWSKEMIADAGEQIRPYLEDLYKKAQGIYSKHVDSTEAGLADTKTLLKMYKEGKAGADWYAATKDELAQHFGPHADKMVDFLAATSPNTTVASNVSLALKAYKQWTTGQPFEGYLPATKGSLEKAAAGQDFGGLKVQSFRANLHGDPQAVTVDRWIARALGFGDKVSDAQYKMGDYMLTQIANKAGMEPRQLQAAIWTAIKGQAEKSTTAASFESLLPPKIAADPEMQALIARAKAGNLPIPARPAAQ